MHNDYSRTLAQRAFSLVELSIVLVILGLLIGGILSGQSLIRAAELRSVGTDFQRYSTAVYTFRDKYFALPGDMTNAQSFWGVRAAGTNLVCQQTINVTTGTCNSDGNGIIDYIAGDAATLGERFLAWQHLTRAGLVEGTYTGASASATAYSGAPGINMPTSKISSAYIGFGYVTGPVSGDSNPNVFDGPYNSNFFSLIQNGSYPLSPEEAWNIDTKLDDGKPATGKVFAWKSAWATGCTTTDVTATTAYALSTSSKTCNLNYFLR